MQAPILILEAGEPVASMRRHGSFAHWIRHAAGLGAGQAVVCRVAHGDALPRPEGFAGVVISGSGAMVTERHAWSERSAEWLRDATDGGLPAFGICYGHQLLAHAFGGSVDYNPSGREMGTVEIEAEPQALDDPLFGALPARFRAHATHRQSVLAPPKDARVLARSAQDGCQVLRIGARAWGVQFHPEFGTGAMRGYIAARAADLQREGRDVRALRAAVTPTPVARRLLQRFVRLARGSLL